MTTMPGRGTGTKRIRHSPIKAKCESGPQPLSKKGLALAKKIQSNEDEDVINHKHAGVIIGFRFVTNLMKAEIKRLQNLKGGKK